MAVRLGGDDGLWSGWLEETVRPPRTREVKRKGDNKGGHNWIQINGSLAVNRRRASCGLLLVRVVIWLGGALSLSCSPTPSSRAQIF